MLSPSEAGPVGSVSGRAHEHETLVALPLCPRHRRSRFHLPQVRVGRPSRRAQGVEGHILAPGHAISGDRLKALAFGLSLVAGIATLACGVAIVFAGSFPGLWRPLAMIGAAIGILFFAVFWDGQTKLLVNQGVIGVAVSAVLFLSAILFPRVFG